MVCGILKMGTPTIANKHSSVSRVLHLLGEEGSEKHTKSTEKNHQEES